MWNPFYSEIHYYPLLHNLKCFQLLPLNLQYSPTIHPSIAYSVQGTGGGRPWSEWHSITGHTYIHITTEYRHIRVTGLPNHMHRRLREETRVSRGIPSDMERKYTKRTGTGLRFTPVRQECCLQSSWHYAFVFGQYNSDI